MRALLCFEGRDGRYQVPEETTFYRILTNVTAAVLACVLQKWAEANLGAFDDTLIAINGKVPRGSTPHRPDGQKAQMVGTAALPIDRNLSCALVE